MVLQNNFLLHAHIWIDEHIFSFSFLMCFKQLFLLLIVVTLTNAAANVSDNFFQLFLIKMKKLLVFRGDIMKRIIISKTDSASGSRYLRMHQINLLRLYSTNFTWSILEYFDPNVRKNWFFSTANLILQRLENILVHSECILVHLGLLQHPRWSALW